MKFNQIKESMSSFFKSVATEFKKITWPTPPQVKVYTVVVLVTLIAVTLYLYVVGDQIIARIFKAYGF